MNDTKKDAAVEKVRPLNSVAARSLTKLVENDFETLRLELEEFTNERKAVAEKEIRDSVSVDVAIEFEKRAKDLSRAYVDQRDALNREAVEAGVDLEIPNLGNWQGNYTIKSKNSRLDLRINDAKNEIQREYNSALVVLKRKETEAKRRVLLASITSEAEEILHTIPTARELMVQAAEERANREIGGK